MAYTKTNWQDLPNTTTPITAARLNNMEDGIKTNDDKLLGNIAAGTLIADITGNAATSTNLQNRSFITANSSTYLQGNDGDIPTKKGLQNWNGAYNSSNDSNLKYCDSGEIASISDFEEGSNTNGNYIKFPNGTMICYRKVNITGTMSAWSSLYYLWNTTQWNFAATFISTPIVNLTVEPTNSNGCWIAAPNQPSITTSYISGIGLTRPTSQTLNVDVHIIAIGKWK